jgi:hypothetical protein
MGTFDIKDFSQDALDYFYTVAVKLKQLGEQGRKKLWEEIIETDNLEKSEAVKKYIPKKYNALNRDAVSDLWNDLDLYLDSSVSDKDRTALASFFNVLFIRKASEERAEAEKQYKKEVDKLKKELKAKEKQLKSKEKKGSYRVSGHLIDQRLKYNYPKEGALDLFSHLQEDTIQKIENKGVKRSEVVEGIKLDPAEVKVVDTLCKMLHQKSQNLEPKEENYYTGNKEAIVVDINKEESLAPQLAFTLYEFTKEYLDTDRKIGGKDIENAIEVLNRLSTKDFLIKYKEESAIRGGGTRIKEIELFEKIIKLPKLKQIDYSKEGIEISKKEETLVILHPIFRSQINSKFITYPADINSRTALAYGSQNVSLITVSLRDFLMRYLSSKTYTAKITAEKLYYQVAEKFMRESRKTRVKKDLEKAIQALLKLELLKSYEIEPSKTTGEPMYIFTINKDFS